MTILSVLTPAAAAAASGFTCEDHRGEGKALHMLQSDDLSRVMHSAGQSGAAVRFKRRRFETQTSPALLVTQTQWATGSTMTALQLASEV